MVDEYVKEYLFRIGLPYNELSNNKYEALSQLQKQHLFNIPFENIDFNAGRRKDLSQDAIHQNIIRNKRGGMCTELNFSFQRLLKALDYKVKIISGHVKKSYFDHMIIMVTLDQEYLVDVGFGAYFFRKPIPLDGLIIQDISGSYRVYCTANNHFELQKFKNGNWEKQYSFFNRRKCLNDFLEAWEWFYSSPNPFSQNTICRIDTPDGNISLYNNKLTKINDRQNIVEKVPLTDVEKSMVLKDYFGLDYVSSLR